MALTPLGARAVYGMPAAELARRLVPLDELLGALAVELSDRLRAPSTWAARFAVLDEPLLEVAAVSRYADQAHLVRDRRESSGRSPKAWRHGEVLLGAGWPPAVRPGAGRCPLFCKTAPTCCRTIAGMRPVEHRAEALDLRTIPVHLGRGSRARPVEGFAWHPEVLQAYTAAVAADGAEGRIVMIFDGEGPGDHWESHPAGDELIVCLTGSVTVTREVDGVSERVVLGPGEATVNPAGVWHAVDTEGPASLLSVTATLGTDHRPRTGTRPAGDLGTPGPEEAS